MDDTELLKAMDDNMEWTTTCLDCQQPVKVAFAIMVTPSDIWAEGRLFKI